MGNPSSIPIAAYSKNGRSQGSFENLIIPSQAVFPAANWLAAVKPMRKFWPVEDENTPAVSWHKCSYPSVSWSCPVRVMYGAGQRYWVLRQAPAGMTIGNATPDGNGDYQQGEAGNLYWPNPVAGTYTIVVDVFDQTDWQTFRWEHTCSASNFLIGSVSGSGNGSGADPDNTISWANTYLGDTILSPSQNKILLLRGGNYPASIVQLFPQYHSRNIGNFPSDSPPVFQCRFNDQGSYRFLTGIEWSGFTQTYEGIIQTGANVNNLFHWKNRFVNIAIAGDTDNQACHTSTGAGGVFRQNVGSSQNYYQDIEIAAMDLYSIDNYLSERDDFVVTNPMRTAINQPIWFPKSGVNDIEISFNKFDNPAVSGGTEGILYPYGSATYGTQFTALVANNFVRCNGGIALHSNRASNGGFSITSNVHAQRNTIVGGKVQSYNWDEVGTPTSVRRTHFDSNVIQNSDGGIAATSVGFTSTRAECHATSGIVDSNGRLSSSYVSYLYQRGAQVGK